MEFTGQGEENNFRIVVKQDNNNIVQDYFLPKNSLYDQVLFLESFYLNFVRDFSKEKFQKGSIYHDRYEVLFIKVDRPITSQKFLNLKIKDAEVTEDGEGTSNPKQIGDSDESEDSLEHKKKFDHKGKQVGSFDDEEHRVDGSNSR